MPKVFSNNQLLEWGRGGRYRKEWSIRRNKIGQSVSQNVILLYSHLLSILSLSIFFWLASYGLCDSFCFSVSSSFSPSPMFVIRQLCWWSLIHSDAALLLHISKSRVWRFGHSLQLHLWFLADIHLVMVRWAEAGSSLPQSGHFSHPSVFTTPTPPVFSFLWLTQDPYKRLLSYYITQCTFSGLWSLLQCCCFLTCTH